jgi:hypothetical protein
VAAVTSAQLPPGRKRSTGLNAQSSARRFRSFEYFGRIATTISIDLTFFEIVRGLAHHAPRRALCSVGRFVALVRKSRRTRAVGPMRGSRRWRPRRGGINRWLHGRYANLRIARRSPRGRLAWRRHPGLPRRNSPNGVADIIGHQQRPALVDRHADRTSVGAAILAHESRKYINR